MNEKNIGKFMTNDQTKILARGLMDARDNGFTIIGLLSDLLVFRMSSDEGPLFVSDELLLNLLTAERFLNGGLVVSQSQDKARRSLEALLVLINAAFPVDCLTDSKAGKAPNLDRYRPLIFTATAFLETELSGVRTSLAGSNKQGGTYGNQG